MLRFGLLFLLCSAPSFAQDGDPLAGLTKHERMYVDYQITHDHPARLTITRKGKDGNAVA